MVRFLFIYLEKYSEEFENLEFMLCRFDFDFIDVLAKLGDHSARVLDQKNFGNEKIKHLFSIFISLSLLYYCLGGMAWIHSFRKSNTSISVWNSSNFREKRLMEPLSAVNILSLILFFYYFLILAVFMCFFHLFCNILLCISTNPVYQDSLFYLIYLVTLNAVTVPLPIFS